MELQSLIMWCADWIDDYYDFYEIEKSFTPQLVSSILVYLLELQQIKGRGNEN